LAASAEEADFDFYVLSLSWSPSYCADATASRSPQCRIGARHGFVVHGLWPQYERGFPLACGSPGWLPEELIESMLDIMPDRGLVLHEWKQHGTCSGLQPEDYFAKLRDAFAKVTTPAEIATADTDLTLSAAAIEAGFVDSNPGLSRTGIAVRCDDGRLEEVRICLDVDLHFRSCREVDQRGCRQRQLLLPAPQ
jgi:ribonuclease T2